MGLSPAQGPELMRLIQGAITQNATAQQDATAVHPQGIDPSQGTDLFQFLHNIAETGTRLQESAPAQAIGAIMARPPTEISRMSLNAFTKWITGRIGKGEFPGYKNVTFGAVKTKSGKVYASGDGEHGSTLAKLADIGEEPLETGYVIRTPKGKQEFIADTRFPQLDPESKLTVEELFHRAAREQARQIP